MLKKLGNLLVDRRILLGRPKLKLKGKSCMNLACMKDDSFKKLKDNIYICECGYETYGEFEEVKMKVKLYCGKGHIPCPEDKSKMDKGCLTCPYLSER